MHSLSKRQIDFDILLLLERRLNGITHKNVFLFYFPFHRYLIWIHNIIIRTKHGLWTIAKVRAASGGFGLMIHRLPLLLQLLIAVVIIIAGWRLQSASRSLIFGSFIFTSRLARRWLLILLCWWWWRRQSQWNHCYTDELLDDEGAVIVSYESSKSLGSIQSKIKNVIKWNQCTPRAVYLAGSGSVADDMQ